MEKNKASGDCDGGISGVGVQIKIARTEKAKI